MEKVSAAHLVRIWAVLGLLGLIVIWFLPWRFQTNDDVIMMWLVSGAYTGTPESFAVFIHPILSYFFSQLYTAIPELPFYELIWFLVIYLSYLGLVLSLAQAKIELYGINILSLFCLCLVLHFGLFLQFTSVAGLAGFSGILLLYSSKGNRPKLFQLLAILLISFSVLIRWESFILILLGFVFYFLSFRSIKEIVPNAKQLVIPVLLLSLLVGSKMLWEQQSAYADFVKYNKARAAVSDHTASYKLALEEKLNPNSTWFFFSQWMMEGDKLSLDELEAKKSVLDAELLTLGQLSNSLYRLLSVMRAEAFKSVFSLILISFYLFSFKSSKKSLIFFGAWISFFLIFNHFFILNGRVVILFFLPFLFPLLFELIQNLLGKRSFLVLAALLLLLFGYHLRNFLKEARAREIMREEFLALTEILPEGSLLIMEGYKENYLGINYSAKKPVPYLSLGWISQSPFQQKKLQNLGLTQVADAQEYYLLGVDANEEFFFPAYMNSLGANYELVSREDQSNFILFHYAQIPSRDQ
tara:strand:+ start:3855 stop:5432 length:1578 start_codon:yes stop_codon:yes gene_type:complete